MFQHVINCQLSSGWIHQLQRFDFPELLPHGAWLNKKDLFGYDGLVNQLLVLGGSKDHRMLLPIFSSAMVTKHRRYPQW